MRLLPLAGNPTIMRHTCVSAWIGFMLAFLGASRDDVVGKQIIQIMTVRQKNEKMKKPTLQVLMLQVSQ